MSSLAKVENGQQLARNESALSREQVDVIKQTIARGASDTELSVFIQTCNRLGLDPFARQIFLVKRWDAEARAMVATPQVSIDGFRLVAERTRQYRGQTAPEWCGKDGKWTDVWLSEAPPAAARVGVYREGFAEPLVRVARYESYVQTTKDKTTGEIRPNAMWGRMPDVMLAKCAESLALRAAFPNELSGVYTAEEYPEPAEQPAARAGKPRRTLDDVVGKSEPPVAETDRDAADADHAASIDAHIAQLDQCNEDALKPWVDELLALKPTDQQRGVAWNLFCARCSALDVDPNAYVAKKAARS